MDYCQDALISNLATSAVTGAGGINLYYDMIIPVMDTPWYVPVICFSPMALILIIGTIWLTIVETKEDKE